MIPETSRQARARARAVHEKKKTSWDQIMVLLAGTSALLAFVIL